MLEENVMIQFLKKFDATPFTVKLEGKEYLIGDGNPAFTVKFHKMIPLTELATSTSPVSYTHLIDYAVHLKH